MEIILKTFDTTKILNEGGSPEVTKVLTVGTDDGQHYLAEVPENCPIQEGDAVTTVFMKKTNPGEAFAIDNLESNKCELCPLVKSCSTYLMNRIKKGLSAATSMGIN